ncbi:MAG TPA: shikimate kinase [Acidimicrobiia bacterium]
MLVGSMGAGKSTVGRELAVRLGVPFVDNDEQLRRHTGHTAAEVTTSSGAAALHRLEAAALLEALDEGGDHVVAAAASVVDDGGVRERLADAGVTVVWLRAHPATLRRRALAGAHRPFVHGDPAASTRLDTARRPHYAEFAAVVVDVDDRAPGEIVEEIAAALAH